MNDNKPHLLNALIIDDESDICYLLANILRKKNFSTEIVNTLYAAEQALAKTLPEIIFLDNHLPDGLGISFIMFIKKKYPSSKIIMITAHDSDIDRNMAIKEGADYFIGKPFSSAIISATVDKLIY